MIEKPNKDGKPPTIEYQEEEILVSPVGGSPLPLSVLFKFFPFLKTFFLLRTLFMVLLFGNATACIR